jgi:hypothetical protein
MKPGKTSLLFAAAFLAAAAARRSEAFPRLASPAGGTIVAPGRVTRITIADEPPGAEEWEAFVSVDGGRTYPLRATPHLPIAERGFDWVVPALPPGALRMKVRFGTGGIEREFLLAEEFGVGTGVSGAPVIPDPGAIGETPAPGEEDTVAWVDVENGRARLVVPTGRRGLVPVARWVATSRVAVPAPKRKTSVTRSKPAAARLAVRGLADFSSRPVGRTIASLSRLNV